MRCCSQLQVGPRLLRSTAHGAFGRSCRSHRERRWRSFVHRGGGHGIGQGTGRSQLRAIGRNAAGHYRIGRVRSRSLGNGNWRRRFRCGHHFCQQDIAAHRLMAAANLDTHCHGGLIDRTRCAYFESLTTSSRTGDLIDHDLHRRQLGIAIPHQYGIARNVFLVIRGRLHRHRDVQRLAQQRSALQTAERHGKCRHRSA